MLLEVTCDKSLRYASSSLKIVDSPRNDNGSGMSLIESLLDSPAGLPLSSKFTTLTGKAYLCAGSLVLVWPGVVQTLLFESEFAGREAGLMRVLGMTVAVIGWFYIFGGRTGGRQFVAATVLDRVVIVPLVLIPLAIAGVFPMLLGFFAILDPILGGIAWYLLAKENRERRGDDEAQPSNL